MGLEADGKQQPNDCVAGAGLVAIQDDELIQDRLIQDRLIQNRLIEDDRPLANEIERDLRLENVVVGRARKRVDGLHLGSIGLHDAAILGLGVPVVPGTFREDTPL